MRAARHVVLLAALLGLLAPGSAAASGNAVIRDCLNHGRITGHYSQQDYKDALARLPTDVAEYSDCASLIRRAQLAAAGTRPGGGAGGSTKASSGAANAAPSPRERAALNRALTRGAPPALVGGHLVRPGLVGLRTASVLNSLPTPLLMALAAVLAGALAGLGTALTRYVRARRSP